MPSSLLDQFDKAFADPTGNTVHRKAMSIIDFSERWCLMHLTMSQRVILKLYAGEDLSRVIEAPYTMSEQDWLDMMYKRGKFPKNVYERIASNEGGFENILLAVGRRGGKSTMIAVAALYSVYKVLLYDNPHAYYHIQQSDIISVAVTATTGEQAERSPFAKIDQICRNAIAQGTPLAKWIQEDGIKRKEIRFETVHDQKTNAELKKKKLSKRTSSIQIHSYNSNIDSYRGGAVIAAILDEFAQFPITTLGKDTAAYFHEVLTASIPQFRGDGRVFMLSTPQGKAGKFYDIYQDIWGGQTRSTIGVHMASWEAWEAEPEEKQVLPLSFLANHDQIPFNFDPERETLEEALERSPASFKREYAAMFEGAEDQWLPSFYLNTRDENRGFFRPHLEHTIQGKVGRVYAVHADPARTGDAFALAVAHKEVIEEREYIVIDQAVRWFIQPHPTYEERPYEFLIRQEGSQPAFIHTRKPIDYLKNDILARFNVAVMTFDQGGGPMWVDELAAEAQARQMLYTSVRMQHATPKLNRELSDLFEQLILEERLICYDDHPILKEELLALRKDQLGRIHNGPGLHDDLYDAISNVARSAIDLPAHVRGGASLDTFRGRSFSIDPVAVNVRM